MKLIGKQQVQQMKCPHCGADLRLISPPRGAFTFPVITTLHCPVCGWPVITVSNSGYRLEVVQTQQQMGVIPGVGLRDSRLVFVQCPKCAGSFAILKGSSTTFKNFLCPYCGAIVGSFPVDSQIVPFSYSPPPPRPRQGGQYRFGPQPPQPPRPTPPGGRLFII
jgi:endogenous inhibitor of DNA gyrase (YacG/DUF329 family)/ribosomal protein S27E